MIYKPYLASSIQFDIPNNLAYKIFDWGDNNIDESYILTREDNPHLTILNGITDKNKLAHLWIFLKLQKSFTIRLKDISIFYNQNFNVVKINVESDELHKLQKNLKSNLLPYTKYEKYEPHITIAYTNLDYKPKNTSFFENIEISVEKLSLYSKNKKIIYKLA